ncbi:CGNR zinc finger domain-containing protein [Sphaerisporangium corydalis]|uniref:CGNR zinc finger domain-containing protein n=1 Tax=Sphaerisporangium corydalis TaxID=1441875 RepID=A0ABV9EQ14_9ACTN|nr:CGNR zinc finger domain-containing protein [Sphaerisporangium corydalis]
MNFNSHADTAVAVAAFLVNTLTPGESRGRPHALPPPGPERAATATSALRAGGWKSTEATETEADQLVGVAAELRVIFVAVDRHDIDSAAEQVNRLLDRTQARPHLERHDGEPWHLHFHGTGQTLGDDWAAACATGLAIVLGSELHDRLGVCTAPHCDRVYVDTSRNGTRRFCSTACQNRVKTAAFRARAVQP